MELEEMKNVWKAIDKRFENQELVTQQLIEKMTTEKYRSRLRSIHSSEYIGAVICFLGAIYLMLHFTKLADTTLQLFGLIAIGLLFLLPFISLSMLRTLKNVPLSTTTYLQSIEVFFRRKARFQKMQKLNVSLGLFLLLIGTPVFASIQGKDLHLIPHFWTRLFPIAIGFFLLFAFFVLRSYNKKLNEVEKALADLHP